MLTVHHPDSSSTFLIPPPLALPTIQRVIEYINKFIEQGELEPGVDNERVSLWRLRKDFWCIRGGIARSCAGDAGLTETKCWMIMRWFFMVKDALWILWNYKQIAVETSAVDNAISALYNAESMWHYCRVDMTHATAMSFRQGAMDDSLNSILAASEYSVFMMTLLIKFWVVLRHPLLGRENGGGNSPVA